VLGVKEVEQVKTPFETIYENILSVLTFMAISATFWG
jgi:hypothetical protein